MAWDVIEFTENVCWRWDVKRCQVKDRDAEIEMKDAKLKTKMPKMNVTFSWWTVGEVWCQRRETGVMYTV